MAKSSQSVGVSSSFQSTLDTLFFKEVTSVIESFPKGEREVLQLWKQGYKHQDIANKLDISVSASTSRLKRARKRLTIVLGQDYRLDRTG
jgi:DNA-directed RNA polymerase specialized sigma24 family protein